MASAHCSTKNGYASSIGIVTSDVSGIPYSIFYFKVIRTVVVNGRVAIVNGGQSA